MHNAGKNSINEAFQTLLAMLALNAFHSCFFISLVCLKYFFILLFIY